MGDVLSLKTELPPLPPADAATPAKKKQKQKQKQKQGGTKKEFSATPPENWEEMYRLTKQMRLERPAPVDTMGCDVAADRKASPQVQRFHTLISLMLSSQTKDTVNAATMARLRTQLPGGLTLASVLAVAPEQLNALIAQVGFHRRKTDYIKRTAQILRDRWAGDIPDSVEGLTALPGVGPKMAHLCMSAAWGRTLGIGVDVHVHRICNLWGWVDSTSPEATRAQLEAWLPRDKWREVNWLLVGFGQTICLPRGRKCGDCLLASRGLCRAAFKGDAAPKRKGGKKLKLEEEEEDDDDDDCGDDGDGEKMVKADPDAEFRPGNGAVVKSPRRTLRRRMPVKMQVKEEEEEAGGWMADIEDVGSV